MVQDVDRLSNNITRILDLARIESKSYEEKFDIEIPDEDAEGITTVQDAIDYVKKLK